MAFPLTFDIALRAVSESTNPLKCYCTFDQLVSLITEHRHLRVDGYSSKKAMGVELPSTSNMYADEKFASFFSADKESRTARRTSVEKVETHMRDFGINECVVGNITFVYE